MDDMIKNISEKFINNEINENEFLEYFEAALEIEDSDFFTENANSEYQKIFKKAKNSYIKNMKEMRKLIKNPDKSDRLVFIDCKKEASREINNAMKSIESIPSDTSSTVYSVIVKVILEILKFTIPIAISFNFASIVLKLKIDVEYYTQLLHIIRNTGLKTTTWKEVLNDFKKRRIDTLKTYQKTLDSMLLEYDKILKTNT